jgi:hypothetical protein
MKARQLFRYKAQQGDVICEMVIWALPSSPQERPHGLPEVQAVLRPIA